MLVLSVTAPLMERGEGLSEVAVETGHHDGQCPPAHTHWMCTHVGADLATSPAPLSRHRPGTTHSVAVPAVPALPRGSLFAAGPPSRAPPGA